MYDSLYRIPMLFAWQEKQKNGHDYAYPSGPETDGFTDWWSVALSGHLLEMTKEDGHNFLRKIIQQVDNQIEAVSVAFNFE